MPVTPPIVTASIIAAGPALKGTKWLQLASAIGTGVVTWSAVPANVLVTGNTTGTVGGGAVTGKITLPPVPAPVTASLSGLGVLGLQAPQVGSAVGIGIANAYTASAIYVGQSIGAIGANVSKVTFANPATLVASLNVALTGQGFNGLVSRQLASGLAPGIVSLFLTGFGTGAAVGAAGPSPGTGVSTASIV